MDRRFDSFEPFENVAGRQDRYRYAKVQRDDKYHFLKQSIDKQQNENLTRELVWQDFMQKVESSHTDLHLRAPRDITLEDDTTIINEWIDAPFVAGRHQPEIWRQVIDRYASMLVILDQQAEAYVISANLRKFTDREFKKQLDYWLRNIDMDIDPTIAGAYSYVVDKLPNVEYRMQHGDLTPWQIFDTGEEWVIFDGERSGDDLPRFNDLAYSYGRLAIRCGDQRTADDMLRIFMQKLSTTPEYFDTNMKPVFIFRLLGMLGDAKNDQNNSEYCRALGGIKRLMGRQSD